MNWATRTTRKATDITSASLFSSSPCVFVFKCARNRAIHSLFQHPDAGVVRFANQILRFHAKRFISDSTECLEVLSPWSGFLSLQNCMDSR